MKDQLAVRLLEAFLDELDEQVRVMNANLLALESAPGDPEVMRSLFRVAHTLKGAAHAANVPMVADACHALESMLSDLRARAATPNTEQLALLFRSADALGDAGRRVRARDTLADTPLAALVPALTRAAGTAGGGTHANGRAGPKAHPPAPGVAGVVAVSPLPRSAAATPAAPITPITAPRSDGAVRVNADKLDALLGEVGQLITLSARHSDRSEEAGALDESLTRWASQWRHAVREIRRGGTPSSPTSLAALDSAGETLEPLVRELSRLATAGERDARAMTQATEEIAERVRLLRLRPFADACESLPRVVRDVASACGKEVALELEGTEVEVDRGVLDALREPILHLVRNAVDHGIESPDVRRARGKLARGTVIVSAAIGGDRLSVTVSDDGDGVDAGGVCSSLARAGRSFPADEASLRRALLQGGISTRSEASAFSGRGVGLDLVRAAVERVGGTLDVSWTRGAGTAFRMDCPLTLSRIRAVLAGVGAHAVAMPTAHIERALRVRHADVKRVEERDMLSVPAAHGESPMVPLVSLAALLGPPLVPRTASDPLFVLVLRSAAGRLAVSVDELHEEQELVVHTLPTGRTISTHVGGAAILPSGAVALVANVPALVADVHAARGASACVVPASTAAAQRRRILIVDDSITTRTLERSVLEAAGYHVTTAVDGADGWRLLQAQPHDLVVSDVEMPRMDGFALCATIRASKAHAGLPVVLVTALESTEHRARGLEVGADAYLGKSSFDQHDLIDIIGQLLG